MGRLWVLLLATLAALPALGRELTQQQADATYAIAYGYSGFIPVKAPDLHVVPRAQLCERAGLPAACALRGLSAPDGAVYLDDALDFSEPVDASILLHELVHYVDFMRSGPVKNCADWMDRERRAYRIQLIALEKVGADVTPVAFSMRRLRCEDP